MANPNIPVRRHMWTEWSFPLVITCSWLLAAPLPTARADAAAEAGRTVASRWQDAVVKVKIINRQRTMMEGREVDKTEDRLEVTATVLDPSGLAVFALSSIDLDRNMQEMMDGAQDDGPRIKVDTATTDVRMRLADGSELPARIILKDKDLDLAFIRPTTKPSRKLTSVDLTARSTLKQLDEVVVLSRLGPAAHWASAVTLDRIQSIIQRPRVFYVPVRAGHREAGCPVFTLEGKAAGLLLLRSTVRQGRPSAVRYGNISVPDELVVIIPAEDVAEVAAQVPAS